MERDGGHFPPHSAPPPWDGLAKWEPTEERWYGRYPAADCDVILAGTGESLSPALLSAAQYWVPRADELRTNAAAFISGRKIRGNSGERDIALVHAQCGADAIDLVSLCFLQPDNPGALSAEFVTGFPDGYFLYTVQFQDGVAVEASFGFW